MSTFLEASAAGREPPEVISAVLLKVGEARGLALDTEVGVSLGGGSGAVSALDMETEEAAILTNEPAKDERRYCVG